MAADIITVDMTAPHMAPANMPIWRLVCFASGADVRDVVVAGRVLMRDRVIPNAAAIVAEAEAQAAAMLERSGLGALSVEAPGWGRTRRA
jgi:5-methylthioadenosine/S-adenosylhomocysteine deaminase